METIKIEHSDGIEIKDQQTQFCVICYDEIPNILFEPCGHGAICKTCLISNVKHNNLNNINCPFCKSKVLKIFYMEYDDKDQSFMVKGEIKLKS